MSTIVPPGCRRFSCDLQSKQGGECFFCKVHSAKDRCRAGDLRGRVNGKQKWEIRLNYLLRGENGNTNGTAIDDIQPE